MINQNIVEELPLLDLSSLIDAKWILSGNYQAARHMRHTNCRTLFFISLSILRMRRSTRGCKLCVNCVMFLRKNMISRSCISWSRHDKKSLTSSKKNYGSIINHTIYLLLIFLEHLKIVFHHFKLYSSGKRNETFLLGPWCFHFSRSTLHQQPCICKCINVKLYCLRI